MLHQPSGGLLLPISLEYFKGTCCTAPYTLWTDTFQINPAFNSAKMNSNSHGIWHTGKLWGVKPEVLAWIRSWISRLYLFESYQHCHGKLSLGGDRVYKPTASAKSPCFYQLCIHDQQCSDRTLRIKGRTLACSAPVWKGHKNQDF